MRDGAGRKLDRPKASARLGDAVGGVAAVAAVFAGTDLADPLSGFDRDALALLPASKEAADGVGLPAGRLGDLSHRGALRPAEHGEHLLLLGALARLAGAGG